MFDGSAIGVVVAIAVAYVGAWAGLRVVRAFYRATLRPHQAEPHHGWETWHCPHCRGTGLMVVMSELSEPDPQLALPIDVPTVIQDDATSRDTVGGTPKQPCD